MEVDFELPTVITNKRLVKFAKSILAIHRQVGFPLSARGWGYQLEQFGLITKDEFGRVEKLINACRKRGILPIDFTAEEEGRQFSGVERPEDDEPEMYMRRFLSAALRCEEHYTPDWWDGEEYYIQMIVEKIDLKTLFEPVCHEYHIPISTSKGWSSIRQRAEYTRRYKMAEDDGLKCVLLYCGDHDPDGLRISEFLRKNLWDLVNTHWSDGVDGYDPSELIIERFGLNNDFIQANKLTWIDNLITGSGRNLASPAHKNHYLEYVQEYIGTYGARKCEANALVVRPKQGQELCREAIENYLGADALQRFEAKRQAIRDRLDDFRSRTGLTDTINDALQTIDDEFGEDDDE